MKLSEVKEIEAELVKQLRHQAQSGDVVAAGALLHHLREVSDRIGKWKRNKDRDEAAIAALTRSQEKDES